jgi:hypothetical protein
MPGAKYGGWNKNENYLGPIDPQNSKCNEYDAEAWNSVTDIHAHVLLGDIMPPFKPFQSFT